MLSCIIDAKEEQHMVTADIFELFIHANMQQKTVHMRLDEIMTELLVQLVAKLYYKYVKTKKHKPALYVELCKALYDMLQTKAAFLETVGS